MADEAPDDQRRIQATDAQASAHDQALRAVQVALLKELDTSIDKLARARLGDSAREHLEILRSLLKAQVNAYLEHFAARNATLTPTTSVMYAAEVGAPGVIATTLRGLVEGGTLTDGQAAKLGQIITERRTMFIFGDRATGKSTLLNALFELVPVDERFVAIERGADLPALKERSFCVRLTVDDETDITTLFAMAQRMQPGRLVVGEVHRDEVRHLFALLGEMPTVGGMATLRAETVQRAIDTVVKAVGDGDPAAGRVAVAAVRPVFAHMHSDEKGRPRLVGLWSVTGLDGGELVLEEMRTAAPAAAQLVTEA